MSTFRFGYTNNVESLFTKIMNGPARVYGSGLSCSSGVAAITRASGSFVTDGVQVGALVSGTIASSFLAGTRITAVSALSLSTTANASTTQTNVAGTFTPSFPLVEASGFPMSNLLVGNRYNVWDCGASPSSPITIDFDLGGTRTVRICALAGHSSAAAGAGVSDYEFQSATSYPTFTSRLVVTPTDTLFRDSGGVISTVNARYWRLIIGNVGRFSLGGVWLSSLDLDLGTALTPGSQVSRSTPVARMVGPSGIPYTFRNGTGKREWTIRIGAMLSTTRRSIEAMYTNTGVSGSVYRTPMMIDEEDNAYEVDFAESQLGWARQHVNLDAVDLALESLP